MKIYKQDSRKILKSFCIKEIYSAFSVVLKHAPLHCIMVTSSMEKVTFC